MPDFSPRRPPVSVTTAIAAALVLTVTAGLAMRWALAGRVPMVWDFTCLRHAHAHLAYYGLLIPLVWLGWRSRGLPVPSSRVALAYASAVILALIGFLRAGYAPEAIVGSTAVGTVWLWTAWRLWPRLGVWRDPMGAVPLGMTAAMACVPFVARTTRMAPSQAQEWVATFLSALLLLVVLPSSLGVLRVVRPWPVLVVSGVLGALALGVWSHAISQLGLAVFGALMLPVGWPRHPAHLRLAWAALGLGVLGMATGLLPNSRPVVIGAVHFAALSVALPSLAPLVGLPLDSRWWWVHHAAVALLCAPIVLQAFGAGAWTWEAAAWGGSVVWVEVVVGLVWLAFHRKESS